jgi:regulator of replication initiation timing
MNCKRDSALYYEQLENGIVEMEATVERLRMEIQELMEIKNALYQLNGLLKEELKERIKDFPF